MTPLQIKDHVRIRREIKALQDTLSMEGADYPGSFRSAVGNLEHYLDEIAIQVTWHQDDIVERVIHEELVITDDELRSVLSNLARYHNADAGINWEVIDEHINMVIENRE